MAELPTYSRAGIGYADLPRLSTADVEMRGKAWGSISEKLDRLQALAVGKAEEKAVAAAKRYAAENPVTKEQIEAAQNPVGPIESFLGAFTGKGGSIYQDALREAQGLTLATQLEVESLEKISKIQRDGEAGFRIDPATGQAVQFTYEDAISELNDMADGYYASVSAFNLEAGLKLKASLATKGNSALQKVLTAEGKKIEYQNKAFLMDSMATLENEMLAAYSSSIRTWIPDAQAYLDREVEVDALLEPFMNHAIATKNEWFIDDAIKMKRRAKVNAVSGLFGEDKPYKSSSALLAAMDADDLGDFNDVWKGLTFEEKEKAKKGVLENVKTITDSKTAQDKEFRDGLERRRADLEVYVLQNPNLPLEERQALVEEMGWANMITDGTDIYSTTFMKSVLNGTSNNEVASDNDMANYREEVRQGNITPSVTRKMVDDGLIGGKEREELDNLFYTYTSKSHRFARKQLHTNIQALPNMSPAKYKMKYKVITEQVYNDIISANPEMPSQDAADLAASKISQMISSDSVVEAKNNLARAINRLRPKFLEGKRAIKTEELLEQFEQNPGMAMSLMAEAGEEIEGQLKKDIEYLESLAQKLRDL